MSRLGEAVRWHWYWQVTRRIQRIPYWVAAHIPYWLKYYTYIHVVAKATSTGPFRRADVTDVRAVDILAKMRNP